MPESGVHWVAPARYHVPLVYLGWADPNVIPAVLDAVKAQLLSYKAFEFRCSHWLPSPSADAATSLWAGVRDRSQQITSLGSTLGKACMELGFAEHSLKEGVCVARNMPSLDLKKTMDELSEQSFSKTLVEHLILYKSDVESTSSEDIVMATWPLISP